MEMGEDEIGMEMGEDEIMFRIITNIKKMKL